MMDADDTRSPRRLMGAVILFMLRIAVVSSVSAAWAATPESGKSGGETSDAAKVEFFEKNVRPILATRCQECHGPAKQKGGLRLDARATILAGGLTGPAVVPGKPKESLLVNAINYGETYQMPPKSKLPEQEVATLTRWVEMGAPWGVEPKVSPTEAKESRLPNSKGDSWQAVYEARAHFWCFQPIRRISPPATAGLQGWAHNPLTGSSWPDSPGTVFRPHPKPTGGR